MITPQWYSYVDPMNVLSKYKPTTYTPNYPKFGESMNSLNNTIGTTSTNNNVGTGVQSMFNGGYSPTLSLSYPDGSTSYLNGVNGIGNTAIQSLQSYNGPTFNGSNFSYGQSVIPPNITLPDDLVNSGKSITELQNYKPSTGILPRNEDGSVNLFGNGGVIQGVQSLVGIGQSIFNMWQGYKQQKLIEEAFEETKRFNHANYQAMAKSHNANIRDQQSGRSTTLTSNSARQSLINNYRSRKIKEDY